MPKKPFKAVCEKFNLDLDLIEQVYWRVGKVDLKLVSRLNLTLKTKDHTFQLQNQDKHKNPQQVKGKKQASKFVKNQKKPVFSHYEKLGAHTFAC